MASLFALQRRPTATAKGRAEENEEWVSHVLRTQARGSTGLFAPSPRRAADAAAAAAALSLRAGMPAPKSRPSRFYPGYMTPGTPFVSTPVRLATPPRPATPEDVRAARAAPKGPLRPGVTAEELKSFHKVLSGRVHDKFKTLRAAWRNFDSSGSGNITREQLREGLVNLNLQMLRPALVDNFFDLADVDSSGHLCYQELAQALDAENILNLGATRKRIDPAEKMRKEDEARAEMERTNLASLAKIAGMSVEAYVAYFAHMKL